MAKQKNDDAPTTKRSTAGASRSTGARAGAGGPTSKRGAVPARGGRSGAREAASKEPPAGRGPLARGRRASDDDDTPPRKAAVPRARASSTGARPLLKASHAEAKRADRPARNAKEAGERRERVRATLRAVEGRAAQAAEAPAVREPSRGPASARKRASVPPASPSSASKELALAIASAGLDKKALGVEVLDVTGKVDYAEFLVVMTGTSDRHVHAIAMGIEEELRKRKTRPLSIEGLQTANWVLMDFDDVVVHVFQESTRKLYDIEGLWIDAGRITVADPDRPTA